MVAVVPEMQQKIPGMHWMQWKMKKGANSWMQQKTKKGAKSWNNNSWNKQKLVLNSAEPTNRGTW